MRRLNVVQQFALLSLLCIGALSVALSLTLTSLLTTTISEWEWENTAAFVRGQVREHSLDAFFTDPGLRENRRGWQEGVGRLLVTVPEVVRIKVWDREGTVLWSDDERIIGKRFPEDREFQEARAGKVAVKIGELKKAEATYEREQFTRLAEIYVPIFSPQGAEVIGILEVYKLPDRLFTNIRRGRIIVWAISLVGGLLLYLTLLPIVKRSYRTQRQLEQSLRDHAQQLEKTVEQRTRKLAAVNAVATAASRSLVLQEILRKALETALAVTQMESGVIRLLDEKTNTLRVACSQGVSSPYLQEVAKPRPVGEGFSGHVAKTGEPLFVPDTLQEPRLATVVEMENVRSVAWIPLLAEGRALGVMRLHKRESHTFTPEEAETLVAIGQQLGMAVANARLHEQVHAEQVRLAEWSTRLAGMYEVTKSLVGELSLDRLLQQSVEEVTRLVGAKYGAIGISGEGGDLERFMHTGLTPEEVERIGDPPKGRGILGAMLREGRPLRLDDLTQDPRAFGFPPHHPPMRSFLGVPILTKGKALGRLYLTEKANGRPFTQDDEDLAVSFAAAAAAAIENARLHEEIMAYVGEMERKVAERTAELQELNRRLAEALRVKSEFLATMSHELQTPLNSVIGFSEMLQAQAADLLSERHQRYLAHILQSSQRLSRLFKDLLELSRLEREPGSLELEEVTLPTLLEDLKPIIAPSAASKNIALDFRIEPRFPSIVADPVQLKKVLYHLLSNAIKFTSAGGSVCVSARVQRPMSEVQSLKKDNVGPRTWDTAGFVEISVSDTGIGIKKEDRERIFQAFTQGESSLARSYEGAGLGLPLVKKLVELHGGQIWVESEGENKGSTFTFTLPIAGPTSKVRARRGR